jgi:N-acetylmuramoyl-L-alanine amidase
VAALQSAAIFQASDERMRRNITATLSAPVGDDKPHRAVLWALPPILLTLALGGCATSSTVKNTTRSFDTVVIDAGHGGHDSGAKSRWGGREKNNNLSVAQRLESRLRGAGFKTVMTRRDDRFVGLNDRAAISNHQKNCVFVSVHFNSSRSRRIRGTEVYYKSSAAQPVARRILANIDSLPGTSARFAKTANFRVLKLNRYPAVLVECGYLSHRGEGALCSSPKHHERLAQAIANALIEQRGSTPRASSATAVAAAPVPTATR